MTLEEVIHACQQTGPPTVLTVDAAILSDPGLDRRIRQLGFDLIQVDPIPVTSKRELLASLAKECKFPAYFGYNWDALTDCLGSSSWRPSRPLGMVFLFREPLSLSWTDLSVFLAIMETLRNSWGSHGIPFKLIMPDLRRASTPTPPENAVLAG